MDKNELRKIILANTKALLQPRIFKTKFPEIYNEVIKLNLPFSEAMWVYINGDPPKCTCGADTKYINFTKGYHTYCSKHCANLANALRGDKNPMRRIDVKEKLKKTNLQRYGVENVFSSPIIKEKIRLKNIEICGWDNPKRSHLEQYGVIRVDENGDWICKCPHPECNKCSEKTYTTNWSTHQNRNATNNEQCTRLVPITHCSSKGTVPEIIIRNLLDETGIEYVANDRRFGMEMDLYIPNLKLAIEVNGSYWHSTQFKSPSYHIQKSILLAENGIRCVFVWDDYLEEDIKEFLNAVIKGEELNPWKQKWFPDIDGWPVDFGLVDGDWREHKCMHGGFECYDAGIIKLSNS